MEVSRMKVVDEMVKALGASILTVLLIAAMTATITTASDYYKVYEYTTTVYQLLWCSGSTCYFNSYSWDFTDKHREIENNKPFYNTTVLRHVTVEYWGYVFGYGCMVVGGEKYKEKVDWPVNIVFYGPKVSKSFVIEFLERITTWGVYRAGDPMYMYLKNYNTSWQWDYDRGFKDPHRNVASLIGWTYDCKNVGGYWVFFHIRLYAPKQPSGELFFSNGIFRYVIATAHFDKDELLPGAVSGWSECAETFLVEYIRAKAEGAGYTAIPYKDYALGHNQIDYNGKTAIGLHAVLIKISRDEICKSIEGRSEYLYHVYLNNGRLTYIYVDKP
jgi:hypothetical protein